MSGTGDPIVVAHLRKRFRGRRGDADVVAVDDVSFSVGSGTTLGLVGESGSGKSTVARCLLGLLPVDEGRIEMLGREVTAARPRELRKWRKDMQIVFQEPYESLDPRMRVAAAIAEPFLLHTTLRGRELALRVGEQLDAVGLTADLGQRYPHELSGGQQQRVNIARALATAPKILVLDEPTSSLDVSVRAGILRLLVRLQRERSLTYVFISHDLTTIRSVCDRVAVMYLGQIVEEGQTAKVLGDPSHEYTGYLLTSELSLDPDAKPSVRSLEPTDRLKQKPA